MGKDAAAEGWKQHWKCSDVEFDDIEVVVSCKGLIFENKWEKPKVPGNFWRKSMKFVRIYVILKGKVANLCKNRVF